MIPVLYDEIDDWMEVELNVSYPYIIDKTRMHKRVLKGRFTSLRINRNSLPKGLYAYDIRHDDESKGDMITIEKYVWVNHYGTIVLDTKLRMRRWGWNIDSYKFI